VPQFDLVVKDGLIFDGARTPRFRADLGISAGRIVEIGKLRASDGAQVLDAAGAHVAPGFIDLHTHYDSQIFWDPHCSISGWHGVTSVVVGNCGFGFAPVAEDDRQRAMLSMVRTEAVPLAAMAEGLPWDWVTFAEFLDSLRRTPKAVNVAAFLPLNPVLAWTLGLERAKAGDLPTEDETAQMVQMVEDAMVAGACGFSLQRKGLLGGQRDHDGTPMATDLMHVETLMAFGEVLARHNRGFVEFSAKQADAEVLEQLALVSGRPILWNSVLTTEREPHRHREALTWLKSCHERGLRVYGQGLISAAGLVFAVADEFGSGTWDRSPAWQYATSGPLEEKLAKLSDPEVRLKMKADIPESEALPPMREWVVYRGQSEASARFNEMRLDDVAAAMGADLVDAFCDIVVADELRTEFYVAGLNTNRTLLRELIDEPTVLPGISDGGAHTKYSTLGRFTTEFLTDFVRDYAWVSLEDAHWRLSAYPARLAGFAGRGVITEGAAADLVVYDYDRLSILPEEVVHDYPGGEWRRVQRASGYRNVVVNGAITIEDDQPVASHPGVVLDGEVARTRA
jgi:N-acyl-D-aspartate/D-glutamate deacylase